MEKKKKRYMMFYNIWFIEELLIKIESAVQRWTLGLHWLAPCVWRCFKQESIKHFLFHTRLRRLRLFRHEFPWIINSSPCEGRTGRVHGLLHQQTDTTTSHMHEWPHLYACEWQAVTAAYCWCCCADPIRPERGHTESMKNFSGF